jgi:hypothetical protein
MKLAYVGAATVGASVWWFMEDTNGPHISYWHLVRILFSKKLILLFSLV